MLWASYGEDGETRVHFRFTADIVEENIKFDTEEILDAKWLDFEQVKNMTDVELRSYDINIKFLQNFEENRIYPLEIFDNIN